MKIDVQVCCRGEYIVTTSSAGTYSVRCRSCGRLLTSGHDATIAYLVV